MLLQRLALRSMPKHNLKFAITKAQYASSARDATESHYDVLKLGNSCSPKQIRDAFIKLSKESHPDRNKEDPLTHERFVRINEAYNTLIKPDTRRAYDYTLSQKKYASQQPRNHVQEDPVFHRPFRDNSFYENRDRSQDAYNSRQPYYGVKGINKVSNSTMVVVLIIFTIFGVGLQVLAIVRSVTVSREDMLNKSKEYGEQLKIVKLRAEEYGTIDRQIEEMKRRAGV